jgi:hypothetical protein
VGPRPGLDAVDVYSISSGRIIQHSVHVQYSGMIERSTSEHQKDISTSWHSSHDSQRTWNYVAHVQRIHRLEPVDCAQRIQFAAGLIGTQNYVESFYSLMKLSLFFME